MDPFVVQAISPVRYNSLHLQKVVDETSGNSRSLLQPSKLRGFKLRELRDAFRKGNKIIST
jgi:hypothetical protein